MLEKTFQPAEIEGAIYERWEKSGAFAAGRHVDTAKPAESYCIVIPPPNVTGSLHMGHALNNTLQDVLIRFERMRGKDVLWQPGIDHAGIATQSVVERQLMERQEPDRRATSSSSASGRGRRNPAARSSASFAAWARPVTGAASASPWV
jgi:valyl-tRNA synthetase